MGVSAYHFLYISLNSGLTSVNYLQNKSYTNVFLVFSKSILVAQKILFEGSSAVTMFRKSEHWSQHVPAQYNVLLHQQAKSSPC